MKVRRVGGGYGCKLTRSNQPITACTLAAYLLQKPVRIVLPIETNMKSTGGRYPNYTEYEVGGSHILHSVSKFLFRIRVWLSLPNKRVQ